MKRRLRPQAAKESGDDEFEFSRLDRDALKHVAIQNPFASSPQAWDGLVPPEYAVETDVFAPPADTPEHPGKPLYRWQVNRGDLDVQELMQRAGITEQDWKAADGQLTKTLVEAGRAIGELTRLMGWLVHPPALASDLDERRLQELAAELLAQAVAVIEGSRDSTKGLGRQVDRLLAKRDLLRERDLLIAQLTPIKEKMTRVSDEKDLERLIPRWVRGLNMFLRKRLGHTRLVLTPENLRELEARSPTQVALNILLYRRFSAGTIGSDDVVRDPEKMRVIRRRKPSGRK